MGTTTDTMAAQREVIAYLRRITETHPTLEGYDVVMIVGVAPSDGQGSTHLIEVDRTAFPSDDGRLHPIAFSSTCPEAGEYIWVAMVLPDELLRAIERRDDSLLGILRDSRVALLFPEPEDLPATAAERLWAGIVELGRSVNAVAGDTE